MHDLYQELEELCETVSKELEDANSKTRGGKLSMGDLDYLDKLTHTLKSIKTTMAMLESGYSADRRYSGRYSGERRDSMGRYSRDNSELVHKLRELMYSAPDDRTRQEFQDFVSRIESMA